MKADEEENDEKAGDEEKEEVVPCSITLGVRQHPQRIPGIRATLFVQREDTSVSDFYD